MRRTLFAAQAQLFAICYLRFTIYDLLFTRKVIRYSQDRGLTFAVRIVPRAVKLPVSTKALCELALPRQPLMERRTGSWFAFWRKTSNLPQNAVKIVSGANSKSKVVRVRGADAATLELILSE